MTPKKTSWGGVAEWYDGMLEDSDDSYQKNVILPNLLRIVDPKPGKSIIDVACGQGYFCRAFQEKGANVTGCDISKELIAIARQNSDKSIKYFVAPAEDLKGVLKVGLEASIEVGQSADGRFESSKPADLTASFDVATIVLALQNIENLPAAIAECSRALKPNGRLVLVINHPAFRIPKNSSWGWDDEVGKQYRRLDAYMSDITLKIDMTPGEKVVANKKFTLSFHRPLQSYFKALAKAGFAVTRLEEWISHRKSQNGPRGAEEDRMRKEIPMFVCLEAVKMNF